MIYNSIEGIPYPFLHDAVLLMDKYTEGFKKIYMDREGGCAITLKGILPEEQIKRVLADLDPKTTCDSSINNYEPKYCVNYEYFKGDTLIFTEDSIDYRTL